MVEYNSDLLDRTFGALADPTRRRILAQLAQGEERVTELAKPHAMSLAAVSKHLIVLEKAGLVTRRNAGTFVVAGGRATARLLTRPASAVVDRSLPRRAGFTP